MKCIEPTMLLFLVIFVRLASYIYVMYVHLLNYGIGFSII